MTDHDSAYEGLVDEDSHGQWAFGTSFDDPLAGVDTTVPDDVDLKALAAYCLMLGDDALISSQRLAEWSTRAPELEEEVALALLTNVRERHADRLRARYKLDEVSDLGVETLLADIGRKRGGLLAGGQVNLQKAAEIAINDFRTGAWGRITLETPEGFARWWAAGQALDEDRRAAKRPRKEKSA